MSMDILKDDIKSKRLKNLYLFYGPEEYLKRYYLESIENILLKDDFKTLNRIVLDGKVDTSSLIDNCDTLPVFSDKKLVIVKNSGLLKSKKKDDEEKGKNKGAGDRLLSYLSNIPEHTCLIFYETEVDKRMKPVDAIKKSGLIVEFPFQKPPELIKWVIKAFKSQNKDIDTITASQLVDNSEQGMTEILNEINKLVMFLGDRQKVTHADIDKVCTKSIKSKIFDLTDAIAERNGTKAFKLLNDMIAIKEPLPKILFMITRQLRQVLEMKLLTQSGLSVSQAASKMGITPYAAGKISKQTASFTINKLKEVIEENLELDVAIKTGKINDRTAAELIIAKLSK